MDIVIEKVVKTNKKTVFFIAKFDDEYKLFAFNQVLMRKMCHHSALTYCTKTIGEDTIYLCDNLATKLNLDSIIDIDKISIMPNYIVILADGVVYVSSQNNYGFFRLDLPIVAKQISVVCFYMLIADDTTIYKWNYHCRTGSLSNPCQIYLESKIPVNQLRFCCYPFSQIIISANGLLYRGEIENTNLTITPRREKHEYRIKLIIRQFVEMPVRDTTLASLNYIKSIKNLSSFPFYSTDTDIQLTSIDIRLCCIQPYPWQRRKRDFCGYMIIVSYTDDIYLLGLYQDDHTLTPITRPEFLSDSPISAVEFVDIDHMAFFSAGQCHIVKFNQDEPIFQYKYTIVDYSVKPFDIIRRNNMKVALQ